MWLDNWSHGRKERRRKLGALNRVRPELERLEDRTLPSFVPGQTISLGFRALVEATGDFTGNGKLDLVTENIDSNSVSILLGNGNGTFAPPSMSFATGPDPDGIAVGDFNGDGKLDLAVVCSGTAINPSTCVSVLMGNGNGTFAPQLTFPVGRGAQSIVAGDFSADGKLDLAVVNASDGNVGVLMGNGNGTFAPQVTYAVGSDADFIVAGDFNGDGNLDLAVANGGNQTATLRDTVGVLLGNGNGTFQPQLTFAAGEYPGWLTVGDFTGDGQLDLAVSNYFDNTISVLLGNGDGTFASPLTFATGARPRGIAVGDFNGDGKLDIAVCNYQDNDIGVLLGNGNGTFQSQTTFPTSAAWIATVGDFTGDGALDLATSGGRAAVFNWTVNVLLNNYPPVATTTTLTSANNPSLVGQPVAFTATVAAVPPDSPMPTGFVTFLSGSTVLATSPLTLVSGLNQAVFTYTGLTSGSNPITAVYSGDANSQRSTSSVLNQTVVSWVPLPPQVIVTAADAGGRPEVKVFDSTTHALLDDFNAYDPGFTGGVRVAVGDVNGDGIPDIITGAGPGGGSDIRVFDGKTGAVVREFFAV